MNIKKYEKPKYGVLITMNGIGMVVKAVDGKDFLDNAYEMIGCECIECPYTPHLVGTGYLMIVDEEGCFKANNRLNGVATILADQAIVGNVLIVKEEYDEYGERDFAFMTEEEATRLNLEILPNIIKGVEYA